MNDKTEWVLVPREPTPEMLAATSWPGCAGRDYAHMLAAAPKPPSAPVGVEGLVAKWRERVRGMEGSWDDKSADGYRDATEDCANELEAIAQQPAAVDGASVVVPRWFMEKLAKDTRDIGMFEMSAAIRRVALAAQQGGGRHG